MGRLDDKVCIITGGGSGIGRASCLLFASEGGRVVVAEIDEQGGKDTVAKIREGGGEATFVRTDVSDESSVGAMVEAAISRYGRVDILFNNVGIVIPHDSIFDLKGEEWDKSIAINLKGVFLCTKYSVPHMVKNGSGCIVCTASIIGIIGETETNQLSYSMAKGGIMGMTKQLANDLAPHKIRVNSICPGYTETPALRRAFEDGTNPEGSRKERESLHLLNRFADSSEIAKAALFLASDDSSFITGTNLIVDGGFTAR